MFSKYLLYYRWKETSDKCRIRRILKWRFWNETSKKKLAKTYCVLHRKKSTMKDIYVRWIQIKLNGPTILHVNKYYENPLCAIFQPYLRTQDSVKHEHNKRRLLFTVTTGHIPNFLDINLFHRGFIDMTGLHRSLITCPNPNRNP